MNVSAFFCLMLVGIAVAEHEMCDMFLAVEKGDNNALALALKNNPEMVNLYDPGGCTALCRITSSDKDEDWQLELIETVLSVQGVDVSARCMRECGPYIDACGRDKSVEITRAKICHYNKEICIEE